MTTFLQPVYVGLQTGTLETDTSGFVNVSREVQVSAGSRTKARTLPPNTSIIRIQGVVVSAVAGIAAGVTLRVGTTANSTFYGAVGVSAEGVYDLVLTKRTLENPQQIVIDATAQASAADWSALKATVRVTFGSRSAP